MDKTGCLPGGLQARTLFINGLIVLMSFGCNEDSAVDNKADQVQLSAEEARSALLRMMAGSSDDSLRFGIEPLRKSDAVAGTSSSEVVFCSGVVRCDLQEKEFIIDLTTDGELRDYAGVFVYSVPDEQWNANVMSSRQGHADHGAETGTQ